MKKSKALMITEAALVAAMYFVLTWLSNVFGLASGAVQLRLSEAALFYAICRSGLVCRMYPCKS